MGDTSWRLNRLRADQANLLASLRKVDLAENLAGYPALKPAYIDPALAYAAELFHLNRDACFYAKTVRDARLSGDKRLN